MTPEQAIAQLEQIAANSKQSLAKANFTVANNIALTAIGLAPEDTSLLVESIDVVQDGDSSVVEVNAPYAAYVEFGTGPYAAEYVTSLPKEWQDEARRFFINGKGHTPAHPFFYPAVAQHQNDLEGEIEKELTKLQG